MEILPDSRLRNTKGAKLIGGAYWVPIFCANCHIGGPYVPQENVTHAFWLCHKCEDNFVAPPGYYTTTDEVFWEKSKQVQLETYGRELTESEVLRALQEKNSPLSKLAKERK